LGTSAFQPQFIHRGRIIQVDPQPFLLCLCEQHHLNPSLQTLRQSNDIESLRALAQLRQVTSSGSIMAVNILAGRDAGGLHFLELVLENDRRRLVDPLINAVW
jgi:hypothetical protein